MPEDKKDSVVTLVSIIALLFYNQSQQTPAFTFSYLFISRVVMVVGAGRGPLVRASLTAAEESGRKVRVYAVEKNPNAVVT